MGPAETATRAVALGDVTGDGRADIVAGNQNAGGVGATFGHIIK